MSDINFVGRKEEIALFNECLEAIWYANTEEEKYKNLPKILSFYGESGVGKTSLMAQLESMVWFSNMYKSIDISLKPYTDFSDSQDADIYYTKLYNNIAYQLSMPIIYSTRFSKNGGRNISITKLFVNLAKKITKNPSPLIIFLRNSDYLYELYILIPFFEELLICPNILIVSEGRENRDDYFKEISPLYKSIQILPLTFQESKLLLNGFFSQFSDEYLQKIYDYTKGKPEQLQFLIDLVKEKQIPAESVLNELIKNDGKVLGELKFALEESEDLEHKVIAVMTHNLNQKFGSLRNDFDSLKKIIKRGIDDHLADEVLNGFYKKLDEASSTFNTTYRILEKRTITTEKINIYDFLNELKTEYKHKKYSLEILAENKNIEAEIDKNALKEAFQNLLNNAEKHGFKDDLKAFKIVFTISLFEKNEEEFVKILYQNNGKSFPKGFSFDDYKRLAGKSANSTGAGIGGYWIKKVIDLHKGEWNVLHLHNNLLDFPIEMEFILPKNS